MSDTDPDRRAARHSTSDWSLRNLLTDVLGEMLALFLPFIVALAIGIVAIAWVSGIPLTEAVILAACAFLMAFAGLGAVSEDCTFISPGWGLVLAFIAGLALAAVFFLSLSILLVLPVVILAWPVLWIVGQFNG